MCGCVSCVSVWVAAPDLPLPWFGLCTVEGPPRPNVDSAHPSCGCPPKLLSAARMPRSQRRLGPDSGISDLPFPSGSVTSEPFSVSELVGLIWKPGQVTAPEFGWDGARALRPAQQSRGSVPGSVVLSCRGWRGMSLEVGGGAWEPEGPGRVLTARLSAWLPAQFLACTHLEAVVSRCRAGLRLRSGLDARALETSPGPTDTASKQGRKAKEKEKNRKGGGRLGTEGLGLSFCSEEPFGFSQQIRKIRQGEAIFFLQACPRLNQANLRHTYVFVSK